RPVPVPIRGRPPASWRAAVLLVVPFGDGPDDRLVGLLSLAAAWARPGHFFLGVPLDGPRAARPAGGLPACRAGDRRVGVGPAPSRVWAGARRRTRRFSRSGRR